MKVSYNWLNTYFKKGLFGGLPKPEKVAELLSAHVFDIEGIEKVAGDTVFDVKILPDRAHYALSHRGIAGEISAILKKPLIARLAPKIAPDGAVAKVVVKVEDSKLCPRYIARRIEGVRVSESPKWLRARLEAIGARSINNIVDATNFVMFDTGQPLHAFDADKIQGAITVRKARAGEKITLLDGREIELQVSDLLIADDAGPLVIAGVKGGKRAEVTPETKNIIIESANFNPTTVRRTSTRADIRNDSSKRFENEITPALAEEAMNQITPFICELSPGAKASEVTDVYPNSVKPWTIEVDPAYINAVTGLNLQVGDMKSILERLECRVEAKAGKLFITPPLKRLDLLIAEDIADEIGRIYGYDKLQSKQTPEVPAASMDKTFYWSEQIKNILVEEGFSEVQTYTLVNKGSFDIQYPLASDKSALRENIKPKLIEALNQNTINADLLGLDAIKIFEIGKIFSLYGEKTSLCIGVRQIKKIKGIGAESILQKTINKLETKLGKLGQKIEISQFGAVIEIDLDAIIIAKPNQCNLGDLDFIALPATKKYKPFSSYPYIVRDIALFVPSDVKDSDVSEIIKSSAAKAAGEILVKGPDLFDRFEKEGKVSYAFRMIFQSFEKTLSDDEVNVFMSKVYDTVKSKNWIVR